MSAYRKCGFNLRENDMVECRLSLHYPWTRTEKPVSNGSPRAGVNHMEGEASGVKGTSLPTGRGDQRTPVVLSLSTKSTT